MVESGKDIEDFALNDRVPKEGQKTDGLVLFKNPHHFFPLELKRDGSVAEKAVSGKLQEKQGKEGMDCGSRESWNMERKSWIIS